jgi:hypothetical protein
MNVDHEFGSSIQRDAVNNGHIPAMSTEKIESEEFKLKYRCGVKT